jgi:hypothetical protein
VSLGPGFNFGVKRIKFSYFRAEIELRELLQRLVPDDQPPHPSSRPVKLSFLSGRLLSLSFPRSFGFSLSIKPACRDDL